MVKYRLSSSGESKQVKAQEARSSPTEARPAARAAGLWPLFVSPF